MGLLRRNRDFRRLYAATAIDGFGSWLLVFAAPLHVYAVTGSALSTGFALAVQAVPAVLVAPWAGVAIDRWPRVRVVVLANLACAGGVALMLAGPAGFVFVGLFVESAAACFLRPALRALTPSVVPDPADLATANSLTTFTDSAYRMIGPPLGTALVAADWFPAVVLVDLGSYLAAAALVARLRVPSFVPDARVRIRNGFRALARTPVLRGLAVSSCLYWTVNAALTVLLIPFAVERLGGSGRVVGWLIAALGAGYLVGSALARPLILRYATRTVLFVGYAAVGGCFVVAFTATSVPRALVAVGLSGMPGAITQIATGHRLQVSTPDAVLGRVAAAFHLSDAVAAVAGALLAPPLLAAAGLAPALVILSVAVAAIGLLPLALLTPAETRLAR
ncbi:Predicted arabinose efflux permease, MFS family [Asanoa hainanensis]|uniref:Predicted arabinose efflux permease, MFS family n=1 Tax=Asanoa hainanensis TaxID=560556 RepID=A0A239G216_9ACTN|nr:MFS transporter [Asanoa hainanensis]SNS63201.1 Predicted arabinose efflux permease, MFS family [Asanoa hainanensis]